MDVQQSPFLSTCYRTVGTTAPCNPIPISMLRCPEFITVTDHDRPSPPLTTLEAAR
jgi:hypothetical protein